MSFTRYPRYKDVGVEWLTSVPEHWEMSRLRFAVQFNPSKSEISGLAPETIVSFLPMEAIGEDGTLDLSRERALSDVETGYTYLCDGDVAFAKITPCFENGKGAVMGGLVNGVAFGTTELLVGRPREDVLLPEYLHLLFSSAEFRGTGEAQMYGAGGQKRVPEAFVRDFRVALPPLEEQAGLVWFVAHELTKLNSLVAEQLRLIELLKEKRQAVISHAVTKGLNPDAPMKPSGVEWLGEVPANWMVKRLKYLVSSEAGIQMGPFGGMLLELDSEDTGFKVYGQENTISGDFSRGARWISRERYEALSNYHILVGDLVLTRKGSLGNARLVESLPSDGIADSDTIRVRVDRTKVGPQFLALLLHSAGYINEQLNLAKRGAILPGLNSETIANLVIVAPPREQQTSLMSAIVEASETIDRQLTACERAIVLLDERRVALISAAVTGKIDVRDLDQAPPTEGANSELSI